MKMGLVPDEELEQKGIELDFGPIRIQVGHASSANKKYAVALRENTRKHKQAIGMGLLNNDKSYGIMANVVATTLVYNWQYLDEDDKQTDTKAADYDARKDGTWKKGIIMPTMDETRGDIVEFTKDNAIKAFTCNRVGNALLEKVLSWAQNEANFRKELRAAEEGN